MKWVHWGTSFVWIAPLLLSCAAADPDGEANNSEYGSAVIAITQAPADVGCIAITAEGSRTVERSFDVVPGQSTVLEMNRLPVGLVTFSGEAFSGDCNSIPAGTVPGWIADEVPAQLTAGDPTAVTLPMKRNARASVTVDFEEECSAVGTACTANSDCCTGLACAFVGPIQVCQDPTAPTCNANGSTCAASTECCSGLCLNGLCEPSNPPSCGPAGASCNTDSECCVGACVSGVCGGCAAIGTACSSSADCCNGSCVDGVCGESPLCAPIGAGCDATIPCCQGQCFNGACTEQCAPSGASCTNQPCCPGSQCVSIFGIDVCQ